MSAVRSGMAATGTPSGAERDGPVDLLSVSVLVEIPKMGHHRHAVHETEAHRERPATRIDHRIGEHHGTGARPGHDGAVDPRLA